MCAGLAVERRAIPNELIKRYHLEDRIVQRTEGAEEEIQFHFYRSPEALIPVIYNNELTIMKWGNRKKKGNQTKLPETGWAKVESIKMGKWQYLHPEEVVIPASYGFEKGRWFHIQEGVKGILVKDQFEIPHVFMLTKAASHYYEVMTGHDREPVFLGASI